MCVHMLTHAVILCTACLHLWCGRAVVVGECLVPRTCWREERVVREVMECA